MANITCPQCKRFVDDSTKLCPGCKFNIRKYVKETKKKGGTVGGFISFGSIYGREGDKDKGADLDFLKPASPAKKEPAPAAAPAPEPAVEEAPAPVPEPIPVGSSNVAAAPVILWFMIAHPEDLRCGEAGQRRIGSNLNQPFSSYLGGYLSTFCRRALVAPDNGWADNFIFLIEHDQAMHLSG